jgi:hypothetical protein
VENIVVHITLPKGIKLESGAELKDDVTYDVISSLNPFYASIDQVRLEGGMYIRKLSDITIACMIYQASRDADMFCFSPPSSSDVEAYMLYTNARNNWVTAKAAKSLILNVSGLLGTPGAHVLANFSVTRGKNDGADVAAKLRELEEYLQLYQPVLKSCGHQAPGSRPRTRMAAKGVNDWIERTPSRTWRTTGMGVNTTSADFGSPTGGRGKPVGFYAQPYFSPPIVSARVGIYQGSYSLSMISPWIRPY